MRRIPILIIVDAEPDLRLTIPGGAVPWLGFEKFFGFLSERRPAMGERTGAPARFSWFWRMDPEIALAYGSADWATRTYADEVAELKRQGDEIGLHVHVSRWNTRIGGWIADYANLPWVESCVRDAFIAFERAFATPCRLFRFGNGWHDDSMVDLIARLGVHIDLTMEPGCEANSGLVPAEISTGQIPDRRAVPTRPYRPSARDFRKSDRHGRTRPIWMLPVSTGQLPDANAGSRKPLDSQSWMAMPGHTTIQLNLGMDPAQFAAIFERNVSLRHRPYAAICVRTDVGSNDHLTACVERNLTAILNHRLADRFLFTAPSEALALLTD